jgi:hypothetical protein
MSPARLWSGAGLLAAVSSLVLTVTELRADVICCTTLFREPGSAGACSTPKCCRDYLKGLPDPTEACRKLRGPDGEFCPIVKDICEPCPSPEVDKLIKDSEVRLQKCQQDLLNAEKAFSDCVASKEADHQDCVSGYKAEHKSCRKQQKKRAREYCATVFRAEAEACAVITDVVKMTACFDRLKKRYTVRTETECRNRFVDYTINFIGSTYSTANFCNERRDEHCPPPEQMCGDARMFANQLNYQCSAIASGLTDLRKADLGKRNPDGTCPSVALTQRPSSSGMDDFCGSGRSAVLACVERDGNVAACIFVECPR